MALTDATTGLETTAPRRPVPSPREVAAGARLPTPATEGFDLGTERPALLPFLAGWARSMAHDANPRQALAGQPARPVAVLGGQSMFKALAGSIKSVSSLSILIALGISDTTLTSVSIAAGIFGVLIGLLFAYLADRVNRVVMIATGSVLYGLSMLYFGLEPTMFAYVVMTLGVNSFGDLGALGAPENSLLADAYPPEIRGRVFALSAALGTIGAIVLSVVAGGLVQLVGWHTGFRIGGVLALMAGLVVFLVREPRRGLWELRRMGADPATVRTRPTPSFAEGVRTVRSVKTLRKVCQAQIFLSASGYVSLPILYVTLSRTTGNAALSIGIITAVQAIATLLGVQVGGVMADRLFRSSPGSVMRWLGYVYVIDLAAMAVFASVRIAWILIPLTMVIAFMNQVPTTAKGALLSLVTPAQVRTVGLQLPNVYGIIGAVVILPFLPALETGSLTNVFYLSAAIGVIGAILYIAAGVDVEKDVQSARLAFLAESEAEAAAREGRSTLVVCRRVDVHYDGVQVLFGVDLSIQEGELVALLGTNGAGKSTLLRAISGLSEPSGGAVYFDGRDITHAPPHELARLGIVQMPGGKGVFPALTVADNLRLAAWSLPAADAEARTAAVYELFPSLRQRRTTLAGNLSGGEQQMVAIGQAMIMRPRILLIDELSLGLAPVVVEQLLQAVVRLHEAGTTIVMVEQSVDLALTVATRAVFMEKGEIRFDGPARQLRDRQDLLRSIYISGTRSAAAGAAARRPKEDIGGAPVLAVDGVSVRYGGVRALHQATVAVASREIVGLIGPNGAGKTTLFDAICGFLDLEEGSVRISGRDVTGAGPGPRCALGLARSFQDARLFPALSVLENVLVAMHRQAPFETSAAMAALWLPQSLRAEAQMVRKAETVLGLLGLEHSRDKVPSELSTGTRRILDLACMLAAEPDVLLLDEPSSGIAQAEAEELGPLLDRIRSELGCGILIIEHDMSLLTSVADRLVGMVLGETIVTGSVAEVTGDERMVAAYLGRSERVLNRSGSRTGPAREPASKELEENP